MNVTYAHTCARSGETLANHMRVLPQVWTVQTYRAGNICACACRVYAIPRVSKQSAPTRIPVSLVTRARLLVRLTRRAPKCHRKNSRRWSYIAAEKGKGKDKRRDFQDPDMEIGRLTPRDAPPSPRCAPARYLIWRYVSCRCLFFKSSKLQWVINFATLIKWVE